MFALGAIVSLCYVPGITGAFIATQWPLLSIMLPLALWRSGPLTVFHWLGLLFIVYATVRLGYSFRFDDGVYGLWFVYIMSLSFWFGSTLDNLRGLYAGLAIGAGISSAVAVLQALGYPIVPSVTNAPAGLYVNSIAHGLVLSLLAVALVSERMWLWALPLLPGIALSGSRGACLALAIGLAGVYVRRVWVLAPAAIVAAVLLVHPFGPSDEERVFIWRMTWENVTWLGWGPGTFFSGVLSFNGRAFYPEYAHNDALQLMFEYGAAALLPFGIFAFVLTRTEERSWPVVVAFVATGFYSMPLWVPVASFLACVVAGHSVRGWALACRDGHNRGLSVVPRRRRTDQTSRGAVPLVAHH